MQKEPPPFVWAAPDEKNILTCESRAILKLIIGILTAEQGIT